MKIKILVCCHKKDIYKKSDIYIPIHVGKAISNIDLGIQGDNEGNNISSKNASYCELTGMYWAWKNLKNTDYIGLCHYRRYFDFNHNGRFFFPLTTIKNSDFNKLNLTVNPKVLNYLQKGYCIVAKPSHIGTSLYLQYCEGHYSPDFRILGTTIKDTLDTKYSQAFWTTQLEDNKFSPFNMFIMNWQQFDRYCNWLFPLLEKVENKIDITNYPCDQKRIYGYMGERLLNVYIKAENIKTKHYPILKISDDCEVDNFSIPKYIIRTILRDFNVKLMSKLT